MWTLQHTNVKCKKLLYVTVPDRVWSINDLTEEELNDLHFELDYEHKEERWWEQEPLKVLDLSSNSLTAISDKIQLLTELNTLDVRAYKYLTWYNPNIRNNIISFSSLAA